MKYLKILLLIATVILVVFGVGTAHAQSYVFVEPDSYYKIQGGSIHFSGTHFVPGERINVQNNRASIGYIIADEAGDFTTRLISVPYGTGVRTYTFTGTQSRIPFAVRVNVGNTNPWIVLNTYYAGEGMPVSISGHQFGGNEIVSVSFAGVNLGSARTDSNGNFSFSSRVPRAGAGQWRVQVIGNSTGLAAEQPFSQAF